MSTMLDSIVNKYSTFNRLFREYLEAEQPIIKPVRDLIKTNRPTDIDLAPVTIAGKAVISFLEEWSAEIAREKEVLDGNLALHKSPDSTTLIEISLRSLENDIAAAVHAALTHYVESYCCGVFEAVGIEWPGAADNN